MLIEQLMGHKDRQERTLDLPHELRMVCGFHEITFERLPAHASTRDIIMGDQQNEECHTIDHSRTHQGSGNSLDSYSRTSTCQVNGRG